MDRRVRKTKGSIKEAFIDLLETKSLAKITVSEIIRRADISRGTFYLHYKDVYDLYDKLENELCAELEELYESYSPAEQKNVLHLTESIIQYIIENQKWFQFMLKPDSNKNPSRKLRSFFSEKLLLIEENQKDLEYAAIESRFAVGGIVDVIEDWIITGMKTSPKILSKALQEILMKFY